jgi:hypothetical protein
LSETVEPFATLAPPGEVSDTTMPAEAFAGTLAACGCKPAAFSRATAGAVFKPTTFGTRVTSAAETDNETREPRSTSVPAPGS